MFVWTNQKRTRNRTRTRGGTPFFVLPGEMYDAYPVAVNERGVPHFLKQRLGFAVSQAEEGRATLEKFFKIFVDKDETLCDIMSNAQSRAALKQSNERIQNVFNHTQATRQTYSAGVHQ